MSERADMIVATFAKEFGELMSDDRPAFRRKFRKMAASPFAFYRGSACLFYADIAEEHSSFHNEQTARVWIHGDLHAENFGTYMNSTGVLVFNVNDFDEAYVGPFTWDIKRFAASIALIGYAKALSDVTISRLVTTYAHAYITELRAIITSADDSIGMLTLSTTDGVLHNVLQQARTSTRVAMLEAQTTIDNYDRRFAMQDGTYAVTPAKREEIEMAFDSYVKTLPPSRPFMPYVQQIKDVVLRKGVGIGSAGLPSYNLLLEGPTQALENDVIIYMKQGQTPAVARHILAPHIAEYFTHQGHRTCESQRALQAHSDPWLGYTEVNDIGHVVAEVSPYAADLDWSDVNEPDELSDVVAELGRATARMHSVADDESSHEVVDFSTEEAIIEVVERDEQGFVAMIVDFAHSYGARTRADHQTFVDLFRNDAFPLT